MWKDTTTVANVMVANQKVKIEPLYGVPTPFMNK